MLQFIEYPKCSTCRKAKAELNQLGVDFEAVDIVQNTPSRDHLLGWIHIAAAAGDEDNDVFHGVGLSDFSSAAFGFG